MEVEEQGDRERPPSVAVDAGQRNDTGRDAGGGGVVGAAGSGEASREKVSDALSGPAAEAVRGGSGEEGGGESGRSEEEKKLWASVSSNPSDFKTWTSLLQLTEQNVRTCHRKSNFNESASFASLVCAFM